jgi:hypothetical protein
MAKSLDGVIGQLNRAFGKPDESVLDPDAVVAKDAYDLLGVPKPVPKPRKSRPKVRGRS